MNKIKDINIKREYRIVYVSGTTQPEGLQGYILITCKFCVPLPTALAQLNNVLKLGETYKSMFEIESIEGNCAIFGYSTSMGLYVKNANDEDTTQMVTAEDIKAKLVAEYTTYEARLSSFEPTPFDSIIGEEFDGTNWLTA